MMRHIIYIFTLALCLAACQSEELVPNKHSGYVVIGNIELDEATVVDTRAVDSDLNIEILDSDGQKVKMFAAGEALAGKKIELEVGSYTLRAYTSNLNNDYAGQPGEAKYNGTVTFTVSSGQTSQVSLSVPMVNAGVRFRVPQDFGQWFTACTLTVSAGGRTLQLSEGQTAYFDVDGGEVEADYSFSATNADGEQMTKADKLSLTAGNVYVIDFALEQ